MTKSTTPDPPPAREPSWRVLHEDNAPQRGSAPMNKRTAGLRPGEVASRVDELGRVVEAVRSDDVVAATHWSEHDWQVLR